MTILTMRLLGAILGYGIGYVITASCGAAEKDQVVILFTTLLGMAIAKEIKEEWMK